jgi:hypothetical protein
VTVTLKMLPKSTEGYFGGGGVGLLPDAPIEPSPPFPRLDTMFPISEPAGTWARLSTLVVLNIALRSRFSMVGPATRVEVPVHGLVLSDCRIVNVKFRMSFPFKVVASQRRILMRTESSDPLSAATALNRAIAVVSRPRSAAIFDGIPPARISYNRKERVGISG